MVDKLKRLMGGSFKGKTVAVLGLAFKPQTDDVREAASIVIVSNLAESGATVQAYDPIAMDNFKNHFPNIQYFGSWQDAVKNADACILLTEWNEFRGMDLNELKDLMNNPVLLDTKKLSVFRDWNLWVSRTIMLAGSHSHERDANIHFRRD